MLPTFQYSLNIVEWLYLYSRRSAFQHSKYIYTAPVLKCDYCTYHEIQYLSEFYFRSWWQRDVCRVPQRTLEPVYLLDSAQNGYENSNMEYSQVFWNKYEVAIYRQRDHVQESKFVGDYVTKLMTYLQ